MDPMDLLYSEPWMFAAGDFFGPSEGEFYRVIAHAIDATGTPVYVYSAFGKDAFVRRVQARSEIEDGRFKLLTAGQVSAVRDDDPLRAEHAELVQALVDVVYQTCEHEGAIDSGCMSTFAVAIRLLARVGRVRLTQDGPGRNVSGVFVEVSE